MAYWLSAESRTFPFFEVSGALPRRRYVDFRNVYAGVLESWLKVKSAPILGRPFEPLQLV